MIFIEKLNYNLKNERFECNQIHIRTYVPTTLHLFLKDALNVQQFRM